MIDHALIVLGVLVGALGLVAAAEALRRFVRGRREPTANDAFKAAWNRRPGAYLPLRGEPGPSVPLVVTGVDHERRTVRVSTYAPPPLRADDSGIASGLILGSAFDGSRLPDAHDCSSSDTGSSAGDCGGGE